MQVLVDHIDGRNLAVNTGACFDFVAAKKAAGKKPAAKAAVKRPAKTAPKPRPAARAKPAPKKSAAKGADKGKAKTAADARTRMDKLTENLRVTAEAPKQKPKGLNPEKMALYGQAMWLLGRSAPHRNLFLLDMDWLLMPPIALGQCRLWRQQGVPIGFATWAYVTAEVEARVKSEMDAGRVPKLAPHEWKCGDRPLLMDLVAPFGGGEELLGELDKAINFTTKVSGFA